MHFILSIEKIIVYLKMVFYEYTQYENHMVNNHSTLSYFTNTSPLILIILCKTASYALVFLLILYIKQIHYAQYRKLKELYTINKNTYHFLPSLVGERSETMYNDVK